MIAWLMNMGFAGGGEEAPAAPTVGVDGYNYPPRGASWFPLPLGMILLSVLRVLQ